jgi:hypothetical protein
MLRTTINRLGALDQRLPPHRPPAPDELQPLRDAWARLTVDEQRAALAELQRENGACLFSAAIKLMSFEELDRASELSALESPTEVEYEAFVVLMALVFRRYGRRQLRPDILERP